MLLSIAYFFCFQMMGIWTVRCFLPRRKVMDRIWLGMCLGILEEMWLPAIFAFFLSFSRTAHMLALAAGLVFAALSWLLRDRRTPQAWDTEEKRDLIQLLLFTVPLTVLGGFLQYTHMMRPDSAGNWNVGQSTYGDLPMHMSFITGLAEKSFPRITLSIRDIG